MFMRIVLVEISGIEPLTSWLPVKRSPSWAIPPNCSFHAGTFDSIAGYYQLVNRKFMKRRKLSVWPVYPSYRTQQTGRRFRDCLHRKRVYQTGWSFWNSGEKGGGRRLLKYSLIHWSTTFSWYRRLQSARWIRYMEISFSPWVFVSMSAFRHWLSTLWL